MAEALSQSFSVADSGDKAKAVASAVGGALTAMAGGAQAAMVGEAVAAFNDVADGGQCGLAAATAFGARQARRRGCGGSGAGAGGEGTVRAFARACLPLRLRTAARRCGPHIPNKWPGLHPPSPLLAEMYRTMRLSDKRAGARLLAAAASKGRACWVRRLLKLATSPVFGKPPPASPCARYMREASATSVSLVSASSCGLASDRQLDAAAFALVSAAAGGACSFASAVASVSLAGARR